jgi:hypothetical protein
MRGDGHERDERKRSLERRRLTRQAPQIVELALDLKSVQFRGDENVRDRAEEGCLIDNQRPWGVSENLRVHQATDRRVVQHARFTAASDFVSPAARRYRIATHAPGRITVVFRAC